jgi:hypothetical protein
MKTTGATPHLDLDLIQFTEPERIELNFIVDTRRGEPSASGGDPSLSGDPRWPPTRTSLGPVSLMRARLARLSPRAAENARDQPQALSDPSMEISEAAPESSEPPGVAARLLDESAARPVRGGLVRRPTLEGARTELAAAVKALRLGAPPDGHAPEGAELAVQERLRTEYLVDPDVIEQSLQRQTEIPGYTARGDVAAARPSWSTTLWTAIQRASLTAARNPVLNAANTGLSQLYQDANVNEFSEAVDRLLVSALPATLATWANDATLQPAIGKFVRDYNIALPAAVSAGALVFKPPASGLRMVRARDADGHEYAYFQRMRTPVRGAEGPGTAVSRGAQARLARSSRDAIVRRQRILDKQGWGALIHPVMTFGFNTARKAWAPGLDTWGGTLAWAEATAYLSRMSTEILTERFKASEWVGTVEVDDLLGGRQRLPLYRMQRPDDSLPDVPLTAAQQWLGAWNIVRDTITIAGTPLRAAWKQKDPLRITPDLHTIENFVWRYYGMNVLAALTSNAAAPSISVFVADDAARQAVQAGLTSAFNELVWSLRGMFGKSFQVLETQLLDQSIDLETRRDRLAEQARQLDQATRTLPAESVPSEVAKWLRAFVHEGREATLDTIQGVREALASWSGRAADAVSVPKAAVEREAGAYASGMQAHEPGARRRRPPSGDV